jgi:carbon-monoxide dehydrogenase medium subunit
MSGSFQYLRPSSSEGACEQKAKYKQKAQFWAGGTDLLLTWRRGAVEFDYCIDLTYLPELRYIKPENGHTAIGALTPIAALETYSGFDEGLLVLLDVASQFATPQIRTIATLGGNLCHAVPSADFAMPLLALDAEVKLKSVGGERTLPIEAFFKDVKQTALRDDELLVEIKIPHPPHRSELSFQRITRTTIDIALVNSAVRLTIDEGERVAQARIALGAVAPVPFRSKAAEELVLGKHINELDPETLGQVGERAAADTRPISDVRTSAAYRKQVSKVLVVRGLEQVLEKLGGRGT